MSREVINMFDEHFSWVNLWCSNKYNNSVIKTYHENLQNALNIRLLNFVISSYYKVPSGHKGIKKACRNSIKSKVIRESIKDDFRILSALLTKNPFFFGNEPTLHDLQAFSNLAQLRLLYKEIQYPLADNVDYSGFYLVTVVSAVDECVCQERVDVRATLDLCVYVPSTEQSKNKEDKKQAKKLRYLQSSEKLKEYDNEMDVINHNNIGTEVFELNNENDADNNEEKM